MYIMTVNTKVFKTSDSNSFEIHLYEIGNIRGHKSALVKILHRVDNITDKQSCKGRKQ